MRLGPISRARAGALRLPCWHAHADLGAATRSLPSLAPGGAPGAGGGGRKAQTAPNNLLKRSKIVVGNQRESAPVGPGVAFLGERAILEPNPWEEGTQCVTTPWHTFLTDWP